MPAQPYAATSLQKRAAYTRTAGNMLVNDSSQPYTYYLGYDSGAGRYPIGPNGPYGVEVIPAVTRITALITDALSAVPYKIITRSGDTLPAPRWLEDPHLLRPDDRFPSQVLPATLRHPKTVVWGEFVRGAVWHGTGFMICLDDDAGTPIAGTVRILHPQFVTSVRDEDGALVWELANDSGTPLRADREGYLTVGSLRWRIIPLRDPHAPIDAEGHSVGVFERHQDVFGTAAVINGYTRGTFTSGIPSGIITVSTPGFTQDQASELKRSWAAAHGDRRSVAILNNSTEFKPLAFSPVDAALDSTKRANMADIAMAFSLDPNGALGISLGNSATYVNAQAFYSRLKADLLPWVETYEQVLSSLLPAGQSVRLDFSELTRPDPTEQYTSLAGAISSGLMTPDEARAVIGLPPMPAPPPAPEPPPQPDTALDSPQQRGALPWQMRRT